MKKVTDLDSKRKTRRLTIEVSAETYEGIEKSVEANGNYNSPEHFVQELLTEIMVKTPPKAFDDDFPF